MLDWPISEIHIKLHFVSGQKQNNFKMFVSKLCEEIEVAFQFMGHGN